jgi:hypothetical protein
MGRGVGIALACLVGGLLGAAARPAVVHAFWLRNVDPNLLPLILSVSSGIGLVVGALAVLIAAFLRGTLLRVVVAAVSGAGLAYVATIVTFLPLFWSGLLGLGGVRTVGEEAPLYGAFMALAGALSGVCGALLQNRLTGPRPGLVSRR